MKNKRFIGVIVGLILILGIEFMVTKKDAQSSKKTDETVVGILQFTSHPALDEINRGIIAGLAKRGYVAGKNVTIVQQNGQGDQSKLAIMAQQLLKQRADVLVGIATPAAQALANETKETPIVLGAITDPQSAGLVKRNEQPGGNITGVSDKSPLTEQVALLKKLLPEAQRVGILYSSAEDNSHDQVRQFKQIAEAAELKVLEYAVPSSNEITQMVQKMMGDVDVVYLPTDNTIANAMETVVNLCNQQNIPIIPAVESMVEQGGVATIGLDQYKIGIQTGKMVADILKTGKKPATTPIYTFKTGQLIINQAQCERLGLEIPPDLQKQAKYTKKGAE